MLGKMRKLGLALRQGHGSGLRPPEELSVPGVSFQEATLSQV